MRRYVTLAAAAAVALSVLGGTPASSPGAISPSLPPAEGRAPRPGPPVLYAAPAKALQLTSDAAYRYERGVDFAGSRSALERATALTLEICGGKAGPVTEALGELPKRSAVRVRPDRVRLLLGYAIADDEMARILERLSCKVQKEAGAMQVTPPSWRFDLAIEEDFVEEVARVRGYDAIPTEPRAHVQRMLPRAESQRSSFAVRRRLAARDWHEVVTFGFVSSVTERALDADAKPIVVQNPIAAHLDVMRTTLLPGLVEVAKANASRREPRIRIFEAGRVFRREASGLAQPLRLGGLATGSAASEQWGQPSRPVDMFDVKADLAALAHPRTLTTAAAPHPALHPGRSASVAIDGEVVGWLGEVHPALVRRFELPAAPVAFEVDLAALLERPVPRGRVVSRQPMVRRDLALVVNEAVPVQRLIDVMSRAAPPFLVRLPALLAVPEPHPVLTTLDPKSDQGA